MKLKPCPFCGGKAKEVNIYPNWVCCERCGARISAWTNHLEDSVDAWNRRKIETDIVEEVKQGIRDLVQEIKQPVLDLCDVGEQVSGGLIDDEDDEEDLLEGDLEDQLEKLMGGDI